MACFETLEEARAFAARDRYAAMSGITVDAVGDGWCVCGMDITDLHRNGLGQVMGGAVFTLADLAFAVAANSRHFPTVSQHVSVDFLGTAKGSRLSARAECRKDGRTLCVYNINVTDDAGRDIAQITGTGYKLPSAPAT